MIWEYNLQLSGTISDSIAGFDDKDANEEKILNHLLTSL